MTAGVVLSLTSHPNANAVSNKGREAPHLQLPAYLCNPRQGTQVLPDNVVRTKSTYDSREERTRSAHSRGRRVRSSNMARVRMSWKLVLVDSGVGAVSEGVLGRIIT